MTYRELKYLVESDELNKLISKYNLEVKIVENQKIFILSKCIVFEIYGFCTESIFYFDMYSSDFNWYSNMDRILAKKNRDVIQSVYQYQIENRKNVLIKTLQGNEANTLKAEQFFFTYVKLLDLLMSDYLLCRENFESFYFTENSEYKKQELCLVLK